MDMLRDLEDFDGSEDVLIQLVQEIFDSAERWNNICVGFFDRHLAEIYINALGRTEVCAKVSYTILVLNVLCFFFTYILFAIF